MRARRPVAAPCDGSEVEPGDGRAAARAVVAAARSVLLAACTDPGRAAAAAPPTDAAAASPPSSSSAWTTSAPGFNPHLLADHSPVTTALATLVLPSVFRPDADGIPQLDPTIATSAEVVSHRAVHRELRAQPRGVLVDERADRRRGLRLPLAADAQRARASPAPPATG